MNRVSVQAPRTALTAAGGLGAARARRLCHAWSAAAPPQANQKTKAGRTCPSACPLRPRQTQVFDRSLLRRCRARPEL
jgi:hypothetical protein